MGNIFKIEIPAQLNFRNPQLVFAKFWKVFKNYIEAYLIISISIWFMGWGMMGPTWARVSTPGRVREG